jgi:hypothetical protein
VPKIDSDRAIMFCIIALVAWAIIGLPTLNSLQQPEPYHQGQPAKAEAQHSDARQTAANSVANKHGVEGQQERKWYQPFTDHAPDWFVAIFTGLLVYVTFRLVNSTNKLWEAGERQIKLSRSVAAVQARNTRKQLHLSEVTAERQLRAYVFVVQAKIINPDSADPSGELTVRNCGQTPAYDVARFTGFNPQDARILEPVEIGEESTRFALGPGQVGVKNMPLHTLLNAGTMVGLRAKGQHILYASGLIAYRDAFGKDQTTEFVMSIGGIGGWPESNLMVTDPKGNKAT